MREQQQQQQRESTSQRGGQPSSSSGQTSSSGSTRGSRGAGGQGSGARRGRASAGGLGDLDALLAQLDEATLRGLKSVYGQGLQDLQDAEVSGGEGAVVVGVLLLCACMWAQECQCVFLTSALPCMRCLCKCLQAHMQMCINSAHCVCVCAYCCACLCNK